MWRRFKARLNVTHAATRDTLGGRREGLHEAQALKDYRVHDVMAR